MEFKVAISKELSNSPKKAKLVNSFYQTGVYEFNTQIEAERFSRLRAFEGFAVIFKVGVNPKLPK